MFKFLFKKKDFSTGESLYRISWQRFKKDKVALAGMWFIVFTVFISIFGYTFSPDSSPNVNEQFLELTTKKPGFNVQILKIFKNEESENNSFFSGIFFGKKSIFISLPINSYTFENDNILINCYSDSLDEPQTKTFNIADVVYPLAFEKPVINDGKGSLVFVDIKNHICTEKISDLYEKIEKEHIIHKTFLLGTDVFGRDLLSRLLIGTRISISVGFISVLISLIIGISLGLIAGYYRGKIDDILQWFISVIWSIPTLLLVIAITLVLGKGFWQIFIAVGLTMWVEVARVVRGQVLSIREKEFVEAARALGYRTPRILFRHILPNIMGPIIIISAANFASAILIEAGLSFLGIGVQPPIPSWGTMIKDHYGYIIVDLAYLALLPGIAIMLMVLAFTLVGDGLRNALDTKSVK